MGEVFHLKLKDLNAQKDAIVLCIREQYIHTYISCYVDVKQKKNLSIHSSIFCRLVSGL